MPVEELKNHLASYATYHTSSSFSSCNDVGALSLF